MTDRSSVQWRNRRGRGRGQGQGQGVGGRGQSGLQRLLTVNFLLTYREKRGKGKREKG